jgi:hypothetical protein
MDNFMPREQAVAYLDQVFAAVRAAVDADDDVRLTQIVKQVRDDGHPAAADAVLDLSDAVLSEVRTGRPTRV